MPTLNILIHLLSKVLTKDGNLAELLLWYFVLLQVIQELSQQLIGVVLGIADQESQVDKIMRVCQVLEVRKEHRQMRRSIS